MASTNCLRHLRRLAGLAPRQEALRDGAQCLASRPRRAMATISETAGQDPSDTLTKSGDGLAPTTIVPQPTPRKEATVLTTLYSFPDMKPLQFLHYPTKHLDVPLRKDLLHKAVVYEGDKTRQGTASTKWRREVRGSTRKLRQQKGSGRARIGNRQSPILRGGGVVFGPKPRDFSTKLPRKMYDQAWRIALSYRYRRGELIIVEKIKELKDSYPSFIRQVFEKNGWGNANKRSLLVANKRTDVNNKLFGGLKEAGEQGRILELSDVDVKDLLEQGRVIIEREALNSLLKKRSSDLAQSVRFFPTPNTATILTADAISGSAEAAPAQS